MEYPDHPDHYARVRVRIFYFIFIRQLIYFPCEKIMVGMVGMVGTPYKQRLLFVYMVGIMVGSGREY
jgi:hypothetical protein